MERLDFATLPRGEPAGLRRRYGYFTILVQVDPREKTLRLDPVNGRRPDRDGIYWLRHDRQWYVLKRYGPRVAVGWLAGKSRRLDARWRRLDGILSKIAAG